MNGGGQQATNICFYSNQCMWSKAFLEELAKTPWKGTFRFVCVDPSPQRPQLPAWLKKVPTLVISGEPQPRTDGDVMNWISEMKLKHGGNNMRSGDAGAESSEPEAFNWAEQTSFAKGFGYSGLDVDTSTGGNGGASIPGAFSFLNGASAPGDRTSQQYPSIASVGKRSEKERQFDSQMENFMKQRDIGMPQMKPRMM